MIKHRLTKEEAHRLGVEIQDVMLELREPYEKSLDLKDKKVAKRVVTMSGELITTTFTLGGRDE